MDPPKKKEREKKEGKAPRKRATSTKKKDDVIDNKTKERPKRDEISDAKPAVAKEKKERENMDAKEAVGDYILVKMLGKGAFGVVYKAIHRLRGNTVAIKQLNLKKASEEDTRNLKMEIELLRSLDHPNIVRYVDQIVNPKSSQLNIVMEYIENGSLATMVIDCGRFPEALCKTYIAQTLKGLSYLHQQGVIHRDIKGANLLITKDGEVKLADFGVSTKLQAATESDSSVVVAEDDDDTKIPAGTPYYMAPEVIQFLGAKPQSDIWSVGCTLIELLTGEPPYFKLDPFSAMYRMVQDDYPPIPSGISNALMDFFMVCFNKDQNMRISAQSLMAHSWLKEVWLQAKTPARNVENVKLALEQYKEAFLEVEDRIRNRTVAEPSPEKIISNGTSQISSDYSTATDDIQELMGKRWAEESKAKEKPALQVKLLPVADDDLNWDDEFEDAQPIPQLTLPSQKPVITPKQERKAPLQLKPATQPSGSKQVKQQLDLDFDHGDQGLIRPVINMNKFKDDDEFDDLDELDLNTSSSFGLTLKLQDVLKQKQEVAWNNWEDEDDNFLNDEEQDQKAILQEKVQEALFSEILELFAKLRPDGSGAQSACNKLMEIFNRHPEMLTKLVRKQSLLPLMLTLETSNDQVVSSVLQLMVQMISNESILSHLCIMGLIPVITNWAFHTHPMPVRIQAATLIQRIIANNVQMFIACRGLPILVDLLEPDNYEVTRPILQLSIDCISLIFERLQQTPTPKNEIDRLFVHSGLLDRLSLALITLIKQGDKTYSLKVCNILINFSLGDSIVKVALGATNVLPHLKKALDILPESWEATRSFLKVLRNLSAGERSILTAMEAFIDRLVSLALFYVEKNEFAKEIYNQVLHCVFHICRLNRPRRAGQEKAVKAGIVRFLQYIITSQVANPMKEFAVPMMCDFVQCSRATRKILLKDKCLETYLCLLSDKAWSADALAAIATWVESSTEVEFILLKPEHLKQVSGACSIAEDLTLGSLMDSLEKILSVSSKINKALANKEQTPFVDQVLVPKLKRPPLDATSRLYLLKVVERMMQLDSKFLQKSNLLPLIQDLASKDPALLVKRLAQFLLGTDASTFSGGTGSIGSSGSGSSSSLPVLTSGPPSIDFSELDSLAV